MFDRALDTLLTITWTGIISYTSWFFSAIKKLKQMQIIFHESSRKIISFKRKMRIFEMGKFAETGSTLCNSSKTCLKTNFGDMQIDFTTVCMNQRELVPNNIKYRELVPNNIKYSNSLNKFKKLIKGTIM